MAKPTNLSYRHLGLYLYRLTASCVSRLCCTHTMKRHKERERKRERGERRSSAALIRVLRKSRAPPSLASLSQGRGRKGARKRTPDLLSTRLPSLLHRAGSRLPLRCVQVRCPAWLVGFHELASEHVAVARTRTRRKILLRSAKLGSTGSAAGSAEAARRQSSATTDTRREHCDQRYMPRVP